MSSSRSEGLASTLLNATRDMSASGLFGRQTRICTLGGCKRANGKPPDVEKKKIDICHCTYLSRLETLTNKGYHACFHMLNRSSAIEQDK